MDCFCCLSVLDVGLAGFKIAAKQCIHRPVIGDPFQIRDHSLNNKSLLLSSQVPP